MAKYGQTAVIAAKLMQAGDGLDPREAWHQAAAQVFADSESSRKKSCPRDAFLGLCETGVVAGVAAGTYTGSEKNKEYVVRALEAVRREPGLLANKARLWRIVVDGRSKVHNHQLDVLKGLWEGELVRGTAVDRPT